MAMGSIVVGAALLVLGALWTWQQWSARSAPPVDDLLPFLVVDETTDDTAGAADTGAADTDAAERAPSANESNAAEGSASATADPSPTVASARGTVTAERAAAGQPVEGAASQPGVTAGADGAGAGDASAGESVDGAAGAPSWLVHVSGAVDRPGVVTVAAGGRVFEAIELAGGASADADLDRVNLAAPVVDGERIHVPAVGETAIVELVPSVRPPSPPNPPSSPTAVGPQDTGQPIELNRASSDELESLPGIGPAIAAAIVRTRTERGPFLSIDELIDVPGIGPSKLEQIRPFVILG